MAALQVLARPRDHVADVDRLAGLGVRHQAGIGVACWRSKTSASARAAPRQRRMIDDVGDAPPSTHTARAPRSLAGTAFPCVPASSPTPVLRLSVSYSGTECFAPVGTRAFAADSRRNFGVFIAHVATLAHHRCLNKVARRRNIRTENEPQHQRHRPHHPDLGLVVALIAGAAGFYFPHRRAVQHTAVEAGRLLTTDRHQELYRRLCRAEPQGAARDKFDEQIVPASPRKPYTAQSSNPIPDIPTANRP